MVCTKAVKEVNLWFKYVTTAFSCQQDLTSASYVHNFLSNHGLYSFVKKGEKSDFLRACLFVVILFMLGVSLVGF